jgi:release factor glutamine methyltransferase
MPIQYIFGETEFFSLPFYLKPGVFIPRPETELLVEEGLKILKGLAPGLVLDLGTGSGNVALSLLKNSSAKVVALDLAPLALEVARENARRLGLLDRIEFLEGDMFTPLEAALPKARLRPPWGDLPLTGFSPFNAFDLIISIPPYLGSREWTDLPKEVKYYEPREALWAGEDGLCFYRRLAGESRKFLKIGGHLLLEVGPAVEAAFLLKEEGWQDIKIIKDYNNRDRIISGKRPGRG